MSGVLESKVLANMGVFAIYALPVSDQLKNFLQCAFSRSAASGVPFVKDLPAVVSGGAVMVPDTRLRLYVDCRDPIDSWDAFSFFDKTLGEMVSNAFRHAYHVEADRYAVKGYRSGNVFLSLVQNGRNLNAVVIDDGPGIPLDVRKDMRKRVGLIRRARDSGVESLTDEQRALYISGVDGGLGIPTAWVYTEDMMGGRFLLADANGEEGLNGTRVAMSWPLESIFNLDELFAKYYS